MEVNNSTLFWIDAERGIRKSYEDLLNDICSTTVVHKYLRNTNTYQLYVELLAGMLTEEEYVLLDSDWSSAELENLGINEEDLNITFSTPTNTITSIDELLSKILTNNNWKLGFFTSGTTGRPKYIAHNLKVLARNVKTGDKFAGNRWGFCYNPTHFAGIQVFLQAIYNKNLMVNLFNIDYQIAEKSLKEYALTHISATPTFYRSLYRWLEGEYLLIERLTFGGEMFDIQIAEQLKAYFPNAKITNVYASTELGSILAGKGNTLKIPAEFSDRIRISPDGELEVHKSLMGESSDEWFATGDLVICKDDGTLEFVSRKSEMINVGGYKVNPHEVEEAILEVPSISDVRVYGRENRITGKLIAADVKVSGTVSENMEDTILHHLNEKLQAWKIPRIIKFVDEIDRTRTGKKVRK